jgi:hypothetical protein
MTARSTSKRSSRPVASFLTSGEGGLQSILQRAQALQALTQILRESLDPVIADHISLVNLHGDTAIIAADSPAWLTKVRYLAPVLLQLLQQQSGLQGLRKVQFKIRPSAETAETAPARRASLSTDGAQLLDSTAASVSYPPLADALRRLAKQSRSGR